MKERFSVLNIVTLIVSVIFLAGTLSFLKPCGPQDDGSFMSCHWAGQALAGIAVVLLVMAVLLLLLPSAESKMGAALAMVPVGILAAVIPGGLIHLCMMETMRCHAVMKPGARCFGIIIAVLAVISAVMSARKAKNNKA
ncbi:MAG: DUF4418 family protein [Lachnospiraceae bacterium]|nr:DUF4418 family protein [Lachnospiraceae bacterium]